MVIAVFYPADTEVNFIRSKPSVPALQIWTTPNNTVKTV